MHSFATSTYPIIPCSSGGGGLGNANKINMASGGAGRSVDRNVSKLTHLSDVLRLGMVALINCSAENLGKRRC